MVSFFITTSGWWAWNGFLASVYGDNISPYDIKGGFNHGFGKDLNWWAVLCLALIILTTFEIALKVIRRSLTAGDVWSFRKRRRKDSTSTPEELDLEVWQEMQRDPKIRERLKELASDEYEQRTE